MKPKSWRWRIERAMHSGRFHHDDTIAAWSEREDVLADLGLERGDEYLRDLRDQIGFAVLGDTPHRALWRLEILEGLIREKRSAA